MAPKHRGNKASTSGSSTLERSLFRAATSVVRAPLFLASDLLKLSVGPAYVFRVAAKLCDKMTIASPTIGIVEIDGPTVLMTSSAPNESWQAAAAKLVPAWPAIERARDELLTSTILRSNGMTTTTTLLAFSGVVAYLEELLEGNAHATDVPSVEEPHGGHVVQHSSSHGGVALVWRTSSELHMTATILIETAWNEAFPPRSDVEGVRAKGLMTLSPLDTTQIAWQYPTKGICLLDLFGCINIGLAIVLQVGILVQCYLYIESDETIRRVSFGHVAQLMEQFPHLLSLAAMRGYQHALPTDILLLGLEDLDCVGPIHLVIAGWPCQG
ncbi:unnamed protein product [Calypogeia fissa]